MPEEPTPTPPEALDDLMRDALVSARTIAVVGMKAGSSEDAHEVPLYMRAHGYRLIPINPKESEIAGEPCLPSLRQVDAPVDLVNLFRAPAHIPGHVDEILAMSPRPAAVWMQLGIAHPEASAQLRDAGITVIEDRCIMVEHRRLLPG